MQRRVSIVAQLTVQRDLRPTLLGSRDSILALRRSFEKCHPRKTVTFDFENLGVRLADGNSALRAVSGNIPAGCVTAVMGSSGYACSFCVCGRWMPTIFTLKGH